MHNRWSEFDCHAFGGGKTLDGSTGLANSVPAIFNLLIQIVVGAVRVMMKKAQTLDACLNSQIDSLLPLRAEPLPQPEV